MSGDWDISINNISIFDHTKIKMCLDDYCVVGGKQVPIYKGKKIICKSI